MGKMQTLSYDDYAAINDGQRYQLMDGELIAMVPAPTPGHQWISIVAASALFQ